MIEWQDGSMLTEEFTNILLRVVHHKPPLATEQQFGAAEELIDWACDNVPQCSAQTSPGRQFMQNGDPGYPPEYCDNEATRIIDGEPFCNNHDN